MCDRFLRMLEDSKGKRRGRPRKYGDVEIIMALTTKMKFRLSFRGLEEKIYLEKGFSADHTTLYRRIKGLAKEFVIMIWVIQRVRDIIMRVLGVKEAYSLIADGTGWGYRDMKEIEMLRGEEIRKVSSHVKVELLVENVRDLNIVGDVEVGEAYSEEVKLLERLLERREHRGVWFAGDRYYSKGRLIRRLLEKGEVMSVMIPADDTIRKRVRDESRLYGREMYLKHRDKYRKIRYRVEQVIGIVKNKYGDRDMTKDFDLARLYVVTRFALYNVELLCSLLSIFYFYLIDYSKPIY